MVIVVIGILGLLVVHAASKATAMAADAGGASNPLPPVTSVAATGNAASPSPASWGGAPGAASSYAIKLDTNSQFVGSATTGLTTQAPSLPGVPVAFVSGRQFNGFDSVPAATKQLSVNRMPSRTRVGGNFGGNKL
jgi:hypothetical protein